MRFYFLVYFLIFLLAGCSTAGHKLAKREEVVSKINTQQKIIDNHAKAYVAGVVKTLRELPKEQQTKETQLALRLAVEAQELMGFPTGLEIPVENLLSDDPKIVENAERELTTIKAEATAAVQKKEKLLLEKEKLEQELSNELAKRVEKEKSSVWSTLKTYGWIGGIAIVLGIVFYIFPPAASFLAWVGRGILSFIAKLFRY